MERLSVRKPPRLIPSFSLTGDVLSFVRCGLQYRYHAVGGLPASRPVQMWFGQFIHGVLEEAYRRYREAGGRSFSDEELAEISDLVAARLTAQNLYPRSSRVEEIGRARAKAAVWMLGPELFPLISKAEVRLTATRRLPAEGQEDVPERYQMAGVIDVITQVELQAGLGTHGTNRIVDVISEELPPISGEFEVIVDYKGMRRPPLPVRDDAETSAWEIYDWQIQTYAELRRRQPDSHPVVCGVILYLNELLPTKTDLKLLAAEVAAKQTDILPDPGSPDAELLAKRRLPGDASTRLSEDFRLKRAVRIVGITKRSQRKAVKAFDQYALEIERSRTRERTTGSIQSAWPAIKDEQTCAACDFRPSCPEHKNEKPPRAPRSD